MVVTTTVVAVEGGAAVVSDVHALTTSAAITTLRNPALDLLIAAAYVRHMRNFACITTKSVTKP